MRKNFFPIGFPIENASQKTETDSQNAGIPFTTCFPLPPKKSKKKRSISAHPTPLSPPVCPSNPTARHTAIEFSMVHVIDGILASSNWTMFQDGDPKIPTWICL